MTYIQRKEYLDFLIRHKDHNIIKVISGIRRSGKSTLFELYQNYLLNNGISNKQIIWINFENLEFEHLKDYHKLYKNIKTKLIENEMNYVFLDEIQHVDQFEKVVDSLFIKENVDIYITGSNAYFMSGELATLLTGRYVELSILPLSFKEYYEAVDNNSSTKMEIYNQYITNSSFPYPVSLKDRSSILEYLHGIYNSIILNDVVARYKISDVMMLESVVQFLFDNIGNLLSTKKLADTMVSKGRKISDKTIEKYLDALTKSLIIYPVRRYNIAGKNLLTVLNKYYVADLGLRQLLLAKANQDQGHILENVVFLELIRRGYDVYIGHMKDGEIDFVAKNSDGISYFQVAATVLEQSTLDLELLPFTKLKDHYPKYLLTFDEIGAGTNHNGIKQLNVLDWLLSK